MSSGKSKESADSEKSCNAVEDFSPEVPAVTEIASLNDPRLYVNREVSLLEFQRRVLEEAEDESNPLLERFKFLSIVGSNLEEFFMVRVAGLMDQIASGAVSAGPDGMSPSEQLQAIRVEVAALYERVHKCLNQ